MKRVKLTKTYIERAQYSGKRIGVGLWSRDVRWDSEVGGLALRLLPSGKKSFVISYRHHGRKRMMTLGPFGTLTLDAARRMARENLLSVLKGDDPLVTRISELKSETLGDLCGSFIESYAKAHKKSWLEDQRRMSRCIPAELKSRRLLAITKSDIARLHLQIGEHSQIEANRTVALLSKMFEVARDWGMVPTSHFNPAKGIKKFKENSRERFMTREEFARISVALQSEPNIYARYAVMLWVLTGVRKTELLKSKWSNVNFEQSTLTLPDTKSGRSHTVNLPQYAMQLIREMPPQEGNPYLIPGSRPGHHLVNIDKPWKRVKNAAQISDLHIHDLRRTLGSWLAQSGVPIQLISKILNHSDVRVTQIYARNTNVETRAALETHALDIERMIENAK